MKVLVAMSGGVDSSVAAKLLCDEGNVCIGCTMKLYSNEDAGISKSHTCCSLDDVEDARSVAERLGMEYFVFNFSDDFHKKVIDKFIASYLAGITPNPCIDCNRYMKFDKLFSRAEVLGCDKIATGHYARIDFKDGKYRLLRAVDATKDQSYVLYSMNQYQLAHTVFPLGGLHKDEVRTIAAQGGFVNAEKPDSQDICFVPDGDYASIIELHTGKRAEPGDFVDRDGKVLGRHNGIIRYTPGQRKGLGISFEGRKYVICVTPEDNTVTLGDESELYSRYACISDVNFISGEDAAAPFDCGIKIRYRQPDMPAHIVPYRGHLIAFFKEPQRAVTPGQAAVMYDGDVVLGGGTIVRDTPELREFAEKYMAEHDI